MKCFICDNEATMGVDLVQVRKGTTEVVNLTNSVGACSPGHLTEAETLLNGK